MKLATLFILLIWTPALVGQSLTEIKQLLGDKDFIAFKKYIDTTSSTYTKANAKSNVRAIWKLKRDLTPNFQEGIVDIEESFPDKSRPGVSTVYGYRINLIATDSEIIYYDFAEKSHKTPHWDNFELEVIDSFRNSNMIDSLKTSFQKIFKTTLDNKELFVDKNVFGYRCYIDASKPVMREQLDTLVKERNMKVLNSWLRSPNAEKQVYAIDGLLQLKRKGVKLTKDMLQLMEIIKRKKGYIQICIGCIQTNGDINFMVKEIMAGRKF